MIHVVHLSTVRCRTPPTDNATYADSVMPGLGDRVFTFKENDNSHQDPSRRGVRRCPHGSAAVAQAQSITGGWRPPLPASKSRRPRACRHVWCAATTMARQPVRPGSWRFVSARALGTRAARVAHAALGLVATTGTCPRGDQDGDGIATAKTGRRRRRPSAQRDAPLQPQPYRAPRSLLQLVRRGPRAPFIFLPAYIFFSFFPSRLARLPLHQAGSSRRPGRPAICAGGETTCPANPF